jgi:hypothetical protein
VDNDHTTKDDGDEDMEQQAQSSLEPTVPAGDAPMEDGAEPPSDNNIQNDACTEEGNQDDSHTTKDNGDEDMEQQNQSGIKRAREDDDDDKPEGEKPKIDPQSVPDPEFVEGWSDEAIQAVCKDMFVLPEENTNVTLDPYNSDLHFVIESNGISGYSLGTEEGFTYMKASTKATCGVKNGCYFYECKVEEMLPAGDDCPHLVRIGWSVSNGEVVVGDSRFSYCYESTGRKVSRSVGEEYAEEYGAGDVIGCYLKLTDESKTVFFTKNGVSCPEAFDLSESNLDEQSLFPHVSLSNARVSFNFGEGSLWFPPPVDGFLSIQEAKEEDKEVSPPGMLPKSDCEIIMMVGLPCCGKTYWANRHMSRSTDKSYNIIGPYQALDLMSVSTLPL